MKLSNHSKKRIKERTNLNHKERRQLFRNALKHGNDIQHIKDKRIHDFMASKKRFNSQIRLYHGYLFIYSRNSHQLYTMYKLPDYLERDETS